MPAGSVESARQMIARKYFLLSSCLVSMVRRWMRIQQAITASLKIPILFSKDNYELLTGGTYWLSETPLVAGSKSWGHCQGKTCKLGEAER